MSAHIHHTLCPVCHSASISHYLPVRDHSVSGAEFQLMECKDCTLVFTQDAPSAEHIEPYYQSEAYISHTETDKDFISRLYHRVRKITLRSKVKIVMRSTQKIVGHHLDIGAGTGAFVHAMEAAGWNSIGVEPNAEARKKANELYLASLYPMRELENFSEGSYTAITLWHVLEHVHDLHGMMQKIRHTLDFDAKLFIAVPNYKSYDARFYKSYWAGYDVPRHLYHFSYQSVKTLMDLHGLEIERAKPMWFDSFYVSMLSEKYRKGSMVRALMVAFLSNIMAIISPKKCSSLLYIVRKK
jgi:2-polyprenyl-3-methyl-5-hydroxy-6-metoxy-1,4-benzoquinol methylase